MTLIKRAGEHPSDKDLSAILPLLHDAAYAGLLEAQLRYGHYVFGYWLTDEMFWPTHPTVATNALAMLRVASIRILTANPTKPPDDPLINALAASPPSFPSDFPAPPDAWLFAATAEADRWLRCRPDLSPAAPTKP